MLGQYKHKYMHLNENIYIKHMHEINTQSDVVVRA